MFKKKPSITLTQELYDMITVAAGILGCSSADEFAEQVLKQRASEVISSTSKRDASEEDIEAIKNSLHGLGYLE
jgi:hypothetical protein